MGRTVALWLLLFAAYAATLGLPAFGEAEYGGDEPHNLLAAESLAEDRDVDVRDEYAGRAYAGFYPYTLEPRGRETRGRRNEPVGLGFPLLIAPAYGVGGATGVELLMAAIAALAVALAYRLALRVAPDPWALGAAAAVGLSPPLLAYGSGVFPELSAGAALAGAALLALRLDERPRGRTAFACFGLLGLLPWLGIQFVPAGIVVGYVGARGLWRARRRTLAVGAVELSFFSLALLRRARTRRCTKGPRHWRRRTRPGRSAAPPRPATTSRARTAWPRCGSTATTAWCAGLQCCSSPYWVCGGSGAHTAIGSRARCRRRAGSS